MISKNSFETVTLYFLCISVYAGVIILIIIKIPTTMTD